MTAPTGPAFPDDPRSAAAIYLGRGLAPVPVPARSKKATLPGWESLRLTAEDLPGHFPDGVPMNVGVLNGAPSGNLLDVDLDCSEARCVAPRLLPDTGWVFGRSGAPRSHRLYRTDVPLDKAQEKFCDLDGAVLVEMRGTGGQTVAPPSRHEDTGEAVAWDRFDAPTRVPLADLGKGVGEVAAAALLARHWPSKGRRDDAALALAGGLARAGWAAERIEAFLLAVALAAGDEEARARARKGAATCRKLEQGKRVVGWPRLAETLPNRGAAVVAQARAWLFPPPPPGAGAAAAPRPVPPYVPFPTRHLPPVVREFVEASAAAIGTDAAMVALPALAAAAAMIGNSRAVVLKGRWSEPPCLWCVTIARSGSMKSPAFSDATQPVADIQFELEDEHAQQVLAINNAAMAASNGEPGGKKGKEKPDHPPEPPALYTSDATIEAVGELLRNSPRGLLLAKDELDGWFQSFVRYKGKGGGNDRSQWLELHRAGVHRVDRITRDKGPLRIRRALVSVCGTIQPFIFSRAMDEEARKAGMGARFLLAMPPAARRVWSEDTVPDDLAERYRDLLRALINLPLADERKRAPVFLGLSASAKRLFVRFFNEGGRELATLDEETAAVVAKLEGAAARLALVHHVVSQVVEGRGTADKEAVSEASMRAGIALARWFRSEWERARDLLRETQDQQDARQLLELMRALGGAVSGRDVSRARKAAYPTSKDAESALAALVALGLAEEVAGEPGPQGGRPTRKFQARIVIAETDETSPDVGGGDDDPDEGPGDETPGDVPPVADDHFPFGANAPGGSVEGETVYGDNPARNEDQGEEVSSVSATATRERDRGRAEGPGRAEEGHRADEGVGGFGNAPKYIVVRDAAGVEALVSALSGAGTLALDLETTGLDPRADRVRLLSLACDGGPAYLVDCFEVDPSPLWPVLADKLLVIHNAAFDLAFLANLGLTPALPVRDTMLMAQLLVAGTYDKVGLADCCQRWLGRDLDKGEQRSDWSGPLSEAQLAYAARDVLVLLPLHERLSAKAEAAKLCEAVEVESRCLPATVWMGNAGVAVDRERWCGLAKDAADEAARLREQLDALAPPKPGELFDAWNWDSPEQVKQALRLAGCETASTADEALAALDHPLARLLRKHRQASKQSSAFGPAWVKQHVAADGRVYADWKQIGSRAGRMSCGSPNLQQLPQGPHRTCVVAPPGRVLVRADFSQIELRIVAKIAGEGRMIEAYRNGEDLHSLTAKRMTGREEVTKQERQMAKPVNFGLIYGMGVNGLRQKAKAEYGIEMSEEEASRYRRAFFSAYPAIKRWQDGLRRARPMETRTVSGRRRLLSEGDYDTLRFNSPVQGTGADGLKLALATLWETRDRVPGAFPVLAVHDEIVVECDEAQVAEAEAWLKGAMVEAMAPLIDPVPVEVEVRVGRTWGGE